MKAEHTHQFAQLTSAQQAAAAKAYAQATHCSFLDALKALQAGPPSYAGTPLASMTRDQKAELASDYAARTGCTLEHAFQFFGVTAI